MSNLNAFLHADDGIETHEVIISQRFKDEDGTPVPFLIHNISQRENTKLIQASKKRSGKGAAPEFDGIIYNRKLILACVSEPDFRNAELCQAYNTIDPEEVVEQMLLPGEYNALIVALEEVNGFHEEGVYLEAKNS